MNVLIIGATGATGEILMREALEHGFEVTALARNPSAVVPEDHRLRVVEGNALDLSSLEAAVAGQDAVLSALGTLSSRPTTLFSESTHNLIGAMDKHGVRRLVCITGIGVGDSKGHVGFLYAGGGGRGEEALSVLLHHLGVSGEVYDPLYNAHRRQEQKEAA